MLKNIFVPICNQNGHLIFPLMSIIGLDDQDHNDNISFKIVK